MSAVKSAPSPSFAVGAIGVFRRDQQPDGWELCDIAVVPDLAIDPKQLWGGSGEIVSGELVAYYQKVK